MPVGVVRVKVCELLFGDDVLWHAEAESGADDGVQEHMPVGVVRVKVCELLFGDDVLWHAELKAREDRHGPKEEGKACPHEGLRASGLLEGAVKEARDAEEEEATKGWARLGKGRQLCSEVLACKEEYG